MKHMKTKLATGLGLAAGYILGTRAGRDRYEKIKHKTTDLWNDPRVQDKVHTAEDAVKDKAHDAGETLKEKSHEASETLKEKVHHAEDGSADLQDQVKEAAEQIQSEDQPGRH